MPFDPANFKPMPITQEEDSGVKMIQAMCDLAGVDETEEQSLLKWRLLNSWQRKAVTTAYNELVEK